MALPGDDPKTLAKLTDEEIRSALTLALFELDLLLRLSALRGIRVSLDLVEKERAGTYLPDYTTVIAHGIDCEHGRTAKATDPDSGEPRVVCLDCRRWV
jgi:hypothetical protein